MNLLIIGNGLDLDLGLPTKYTDFLDFVNAFTFSVGNDVEKINEIDEFNKNAYTYRAIFERYKNFHLNNLNDEHQKLKNTLENFDEIFSHKFINKACKDFFHCVHNNCWIEYFNERYEQNLIAGENWIDLEGEIQRVIDIFETKGFFEIVDDKHHKNINPTSNFIADSLKIQKLIDEFYSSKTTLFTADYKKFKENLLQDFEKFVMALGIYLDFFVGQIKPNVAKSSKELQKLLTSDSIGHVLSFNYINNFKKETLSPDNVCFIHGAVHYLQDLQENFTENLESEDKDFLNIEKIIHRNKMIIGFDSLQNSDAFSAEDFELEFVDYRKYFQRIYKGTDCSYIDWLNEYQDHLRKYVRTTTNTENWENLYQQRLQAQLSCNTPNKVFIFGHSLDATDNEILKDIFLREYDDTKIIIYYHDPDARKRIITNLIKILGKPTLVEKTKGKNPTITFVAQSYADL